jgi:hypothetical protein
MNIQKPLVIIDFDGVINPMAQMPWEAVWPDMTDSSFTEDMGYRTPITYSPTVVKFFHDLLHHADVIWLTTWKSDTKFFPDACGFPEIPWLDEIPGKYVRNWWKADVIASLPRERRILWIDDEIPNNPDSEEQVLIETFNGNLVPIVPTTSIGLTPEHLDYIQNFVIAR